MHGGLQKGNRVRNISKSYGKIDILSSQASPGIERLHKMLSKGLKTIHFKEDRLPVHISHIVRHVQHPFDLKWPSTPYLPPAGFTTLSLFSFHVGRYLTERAHDLWWSLHIRAHGLFSETRGVRSYPTQVT